MVRARTPIKTVTGLARTQPRKEFRSHQVVAEGASLVPVLFVRVLVLVLVQPHVGPFLLLFLLHLDLLASFLLRRLAPFWCGRVCPRRGERGEGGRNLQVGVRDRGLGLGQRRRGLGGWSRHDDGHLDGPVPALLDDGRERGAVELHLGRGLAVGSALPARREAVPVVIHRGVGHDVSHCLGEDVVVLPHRAHDGLLGRSWDPRLGAFRERPRPPPGLGAAC
mmetsp:Transcript_7480/g.16479  ORF Transcript_7480/g.16479 Transcript_7480/m.16479 type:complete len:222 (-) Transcript_7480:1147-1812(-)